MNCLHRCYIFEKDDVRQAVCSYFESQIYKKFWKCNLENHKKVVKNFTAFREPGIANGMYLLHMHFRFKIVL